MAIQDFYYKKDINNNNNNTSIDIFIWTTNERSNKFVRLLIYILQREN